MAVTPPPLEASAPAAPGTSAAAAEASAGGTGANGGAGGARDAAGTAMPLLKQALALWRELPGLVGDRVELFALELRCAGRALAIIGFLLVAAAMLGVTGWVLLWALIVGLLLQAGLSLAVALSLPLLATGIAAAFAVAGIRRQLPRLGMQATRRHLNVTPSPMPESETAAASHLPNITPEHGTHTARTAPAAR